jgi:hypothetical protein
VTRERIVLIVDNGRPDGPWWPGAQDVTVLSREPLPDPLVQTFLLTIEHAACSSPTFAETIQRVIERHLFDSLHTVTVVEVTEQ